MARGAAFVTGASRGIGADTCVGLARAGFDVAFTYRNYGRVAQLPQYEPIARSKHAGETALRQRVPALGVRLLVVTGDLVEGTITATLLERADPSVRALRADVEHRLPSIGDMANAVVTAALDERLPSGHTVVVGRDLASLATV